MTLICSIILVVTVSYILVLTLFNRSSSSCFLKIFDLSLIFLCVSALLYYIIIVKKTKKEELFVDQTQPYEENISYINHGLTLYYSAFSSTSYNPAQGNQGDLRKWYNISPFFKEADKNTCAIARYAESHMSFYGTPTFSKQDGFVLGSNFLTGPMSYTLGISGNTQYSIFVFIKFGGISISTKDIEVFQLFGNTQNMNGVRMYITGNNVESKTNSAQVNLYLGLGDATVFQCKAVVNSGSIELQYGKPYLFIMTNNNSNIKMAMYDSSDGNKIDLINAPVTSQMFDISFSNKNMLINQYKNINGNLYSFGVYNKVMADNDMLNLQKHLFSQIQVLEPKVLERDRVIESLTADIKTMKACPFDPTTCEACKSVTDWTDINAIMTTRDARCLEAIDKYCTDNPSHAMCKCWNSNDNAYTTTQCQNFRNIFADKACVDINNIDRIELSRIKSKYGLCTCQEEVISLQPLKIPELSKFKIPSDLASKLSSSCPSSSSPSTASSGASLGASMTPLTSLQQQTAGQQASNGAFSGYDKDMSNDLINFFNTVKNANLNNQVLAAQNESRVKKAVTRPIPDYFADINVKQPPTSQGDLLPLSTDPPGQPLTSFWSNFKT